MKLIIVFSGLLLWAAAMQAQIAAPTVTQTVNAPLINPASFTLKSSPNPSLTTDVVTYTGAITGPAGQPVPQGTVTVCDGGTGFSCTGGIAVATVKLDTTGQFSCTESNMTAGVHTITAHFTSTDKIYANSQ